MVAHPTWYHYEREQHKIYFLLNQPRFVSGDEVMAKIFLRSYSQEQYAFSHGSVFVSLQDSSWNMLLQKEVTPDEWGTYDFRYQLPADAQPGRYCLRVRGWCMGEYYFDVNQEEKKEQEKAVQTGKTEPSPSSILSLHTEKIQYSLGEDIKISLKLAKASSPVLITWEGQSLLGHHAIPCCPEEYSFTLKSSPSLCPEIRVSAYLFQQDSILEASQKISVFDTDKILQIHAQESPEKKGEWKIQILDKQNQPALAKVCLAADMISHRDHPERENIENFYYGSRYIDIPTVDSLDFEFTTDREYSCLQPIAIKLNHNPSSLVQKSLPAFSIGYKNVYWHSCETAENGWITIQMGDSQEKTLRLTIIAIDKKSRVGQKSIFLNY